MNKHFIKNIDFSKPIDTTSLVEYQKGTVISKTLSQNKYVNITLFAFDKDEEISTHKSEGDAMVSILDGEAMITIGEESFKVKKGETIVMPANINHSLLAIERFKMILTVLFDVEK
ncbi:cupin domain-containing protein [Tepidibacter mesophilus]|uniref:cupin domain-containing protein n=1 Tax=Tepidibacter mesophilus TaxID=655607 RepID=UPI000C0685F1|nr:cupin domain-containing protein [Tepidibacter mesophilus]